MKQEVGYHGMEPATQNQTKTGKWKQPEDTKPTIFRRTQPRSGCLDAMLELQPDAFPAGLLLRGQFPAEHMERTNHSVLFLQEKKHRDQ
jgi:hypothetical protein